MPTVPNTNFAFLQEHDEHLLRLGMLAERYFSEDPNTCLLKLRQLAESLAQFAAANANLYTNDAETQHDLLRRLQFQGVLPREAFDLFDQVRRAGNEAAHVYADSHGDALLTLRVAWQLALWYHRTFKDPGYKSGPFIPPKPPADESELLKIELARLAKEREEFQRTHEQTAVRLHQIEEDLSRARDEQAFWEQMALDAETSRISLQQELAARSAAQATPAQFATIVKRANRAAGQLNIDEAETRKLIDEQLRQAGWEADTVTLRHSTGARPTKGKNCAIAEWPTNSGFADYVLFIGLKPVAAIEAKRKNTDVSSALQQAKRYSRGFTLNAEMTPPGGPWDDFHLPFVYSANGRPYLKQISTHSGIWFADLRRPENLSRALDGWHSPEGLASLLKQDEDAANNRLKSEPFNYGFGLRDYQKLAIKAVEARIEQGERRMLLAMATGTGKTKTCIALIYRLLKTQRFKSILFLVDRSALGEQAANAFKDTRMENLQTFADIFGIKELQDKTPDPDTCVHIATVQGMVKRVLFPTEAAPAPNVDQYDCIIVDECHRGYLMDRELSDDELTFRNQEDYVSKYRRVIEYFDAVKVGLTATPALHTTDIFGMPVFTYSYREAVVDDYLVDHEPPYQIKTELSESGINWKAGDQVKRYDYDKSQLELFTATDNIEIEIDGFNKKVITRPFNSAVCGALAKEIDPSAEGKTLVFCANDAHADLVVELLKEAFEKQYGEVEDDAVMKITGKSDQPLSLIRRYKNERNPNVAVTVDLLTTGIDVPKICNIVFLRRVNSRILFDQMLGRATRLCTEIEKDTFRIFDAVKIYEALQGMTAMKPVVVDPNISFAQMTQELASVDNEEILVQVRDQFAAKFNRKKRQISAADRYQFEAVAGMTPEEFIQQLRALPVQEIASWMTKYAGVGEILDNSSPGQKGVALYSEHPDSVTKIDRGYGEAIKPDDYLNAFAAFLRDNEDKIPGLKTVLTRPRDLTRKDLRELALALDSAGFTEANLTVAWREVKHQDVAARIVGFIRAVAANENLISYEQRVDLAVQKILASRTWSNPQRQWLNRIAAHTKTNMIVDQDTIDDPMLPFRQESGGFKRLDRVFDGQLQQIIDSLHEAIWDAAA